MYKIATGEIVKIVKNNGINPEAVFNVISVGSGNSVQFQKLFHKVLQGDYSTTFALKLMRKDIAIAMEMAQDIEVPMASLVFDLYEKSAVYDELDNCAASKYEIEDLK